MRIYIDESGPFTGKNNISVVGALIIPDIKFDGFLKLYGRIRRKLPNDDAEVKGRLLNENQIPEILRILQKLLCTFNAIAIDSSFHTEEEIINHKSKQEEGITRHLTPEHHRTLVDDVWNLRRRLEAMSLQLYIQSCLMSELIYDVLYDNNIFYSLRFPSELGRYIWTIDAKDIDKMTPWEDWWLKTLGPMIESKSLKRPLPQIEGGDYRWHERFATHNSDESYIHYLKDKFGLSSPLDSDEFFDLRPVLNEQFEFKSGIDYGLEAVDILTNVIRRSLVGNFGRNGWLPIRRIMIHKPKHYIRFLTFASEPPDTSNAPYQTVLRDFSHGGRSMLTKI